jgi:tRNA threonylcarbamoyladenosine biosynthesis protein TsaB
MHNGGVKVCRAGRTVQPLSKQPADVKLKAGPSSSPEEVGTIVRILALETSETAGSVAALDDDKLLKQLDLSSAARSAQSLAPALESLWREVAWRPADVQLVAVTIGPGSFTGLRVGVTTAKVLAYAVQAAILGVDTLEIIAEQSPPQVPRVWAVVDAQRGQVMAREFVRDAEGRFGPVTAATLVDTDPWLAGLPEGAAVSGPILRKLQSQIPNGVQALEPSCWTPQAATVGRVAWRRYQAGERGDVWQILPCYSRRAAAEEKWDARQKASRSP